MHEAVQAGPEVSSVVQILMDAIQDLPFSVKEMH